MEGHLTLGSAAGRAAPARRGSGTTTGSSSGYGYG